MAPSRLDRARLALRQLGIASTESRWRGRRFPTCSTNVAPRAASAMTCGVGVPERSRGPQSSENGERFPGEVARALVECRRNRSHTRFHVPRLWDLWPRPLQQLDQDWDKVYVDEFPEVSDDFLLMPGGSQSTRISPDAGSPTRPRTSSPHSAFPAFPHRPLRCQCVSIQQSSSTSLFWLWADGFRGSGPWSGGFFPGSALPPRLWCPWTPCRCAERLGFGSRRADAFLRLPRSSSWSPTDRRCQPRLVPTWRSYSSFSRNAWSCPRR